MSEAEYGHKRLLKDLVILLKRASEFHFHDFKAPGPIATPKLDFVIALTAFVEKTKAGIYDDRPDANDEAELYEICKRQGMSEAMMKILGLDK